jgi:hypothetical protein
MTSVASGGAAERIVARIVFKVVRAGSGTPARYSSIVLGTCPDFSAALRRAGLTGFTENLFTEGNQENEEKPAELLSKTLPALFLRYLPQKIFVLLSLTSLSFTRGAQVLAVLMQHHRDYLTGPIAFEIQLCLYDLIEELISRAGVDREGRLPCELRLQLSIL